MTTSTYREAFRERIARIIAQHKGETLSELRRLLREAFPMGPRKYHPYKMWLKECRAQILATLPPPGFNALDLKNRVAVGIMADWWEERGDLERARLLRTYRPKRGPVRKGEKRPVAKDERQAELF